MICSPQFFNSAFAKELRKVTGDNNTKFYSYIGNVTENEDFKKEFSEWYQSKYGEIPSMQNEKKFSDYVKSIEEYYKTSKKSTNDTFISDHQKTAYDYRLGYTNFDIRNEAMQHSGNVLLNRYKEINDNGIIIRGNHENYYFNFLKQFWKSELYNIILQQTKTAEEYNELERSENKKLLIDEISKLRNEAIVSGNELAYIEKHLQDKDNIKIKNMLATVKELYSSRGKAYFDSVISTKKLQPLFNDISPEIDVDADIEKAADAENTDSQQDSSEEKQEDVDTFITAVTNHIGSFSDFNTHVSERIKVYFNTLPVLLDENVGTNANNLIIDTNNTFGFANYMNDAQCSQMMYRLQFVNKDQMIREIERTAKTNPDFRAFAKFAADLRNNPDFATEVATVYMKTNMPRTEANIKNGMVTQHISNNRSNAKESLWYDLMNDYKECVVRTDNQAMLEKLIKCNGEQEAFYQVFHAYFPSITYNSFILANSNNLRNRLIKLLKESNNIIERVYQREDAKNKVIQEVIDDAEANGKKVTRINWMQYATKQQIDDYDSYNNDYLNQGDANKIKDIRDILLPFCSVKTDLNARNVHGNNSSSIINNSRMTWLAKMLGETVETYKLNDDSNTYLTADEYEEFKKIKAAKWETLTKEQQELRKKGVVVKQENPVLLQWGSEMIKSNQYQNCPYFLDKPGMPGIFKYENGLLTLNEDNLSGTSTPLELMKITLFDGASNNDSNKHATYSDMTEGDFLPTVFKTFTQATDEYNQLADKTMRLFFPRTPSDAPKTFVFQMPKFNTAELINIDSSRTAIINAINEGVATKYTTAANNEFKHTDKVINMNVDAIKKVVTGDWDYINIQKDSASKKNEDGTDSVLVLDTSTDPTLIRSYYSFKGSIEKTDKGYILKNPKLEAVYNKGGVAFSGTVVGDSLRSDLWTQTALHDVEYKGHIFEKQHVKLNTNTNEYNVLKGLFKQELIDAYTAMDHYFDFTSTGKVRCTKDQNSVIPKAIRPVLKKGISANSGYKFYHLGNNGEVFEQVKDSNGQVIGYRLGGNVFHSSKFSCNVTDENGNVRTVNFMDEMFSEDLTWKDKSTINFLYGRATNDVLVRDSDGIIRDVNLTEEQEARLSQCLEKFVQAKCDHVIKELDNYKEVFGHLPTLKESADFALNYFMFFNASDMLLEGNTKFYKNSQTVLKRAKEDQASGVPYGISNPMIGDLAASEEIESYLDTASFKIDAKDENGKIIVDENGKAIKTDKFLQDLFKECGFGEIKMRTKFRAVTIKNTQMTNHAALESLLKELTSKEVGMDEDAARMLLYGPVEFNKDGSTKLDENGQPIRRGGFTETKVNDAQSYILFEEWVRRIAGRGQLDKYIPLIKKILNPNIRLTAKDIKEFVQVQKNIYYDIHRDNDFGIDIPRQIKNAEFVLVPRFIKGTELEAVYNMMKKAGIDQLNTVETSKAANRELVTIWDNNEQLVKELLDTNSEDFNNFCADVSNMAQDYSYNNLYTQQETPQHMDSTNKAGIQIVKKIIDNVNNDNFWKKEFFNVFGENIRSSCIDLMDELGIPVTKDGSMDMSILNELPVETKKKIYQKFARELLRRGMDSNLKDYITLDETGNPIMPTIMSNNINILEQSVQSIFNSTITRQKLPGFHAAQVTNVGFRTHEQLYNAFEKELKDKGTLSSNGIKSVTYNKHLEYHPVKNGKPQHYIEVMLPASYLGIDKNSRHYKDMSMEDILKELQEDKLDEVIGYRIPTEGKQSVCVMKIVGLLDDAQGSTIIVPNDWVTQTGSDFDIDSVYGINYPTKKRYDGKVEKILYKKDGFNIYDYAKYLTGKSNTKGLVKKITKDYYKKVNDEANESFMNVLNHFVSPKMKKRTLIALKDAHRELDEINGDNEEQTKIDYAIEVMAIIEDVYKRTEKSRKKYPQIQQAFDNCISKWQKLYDYLNEDFEAIANNESESDFFNGLKEHLNEEAKKQGAVDFDTYIKDVSAYPERYNTKKQRDSRILDCFMELLKDPANLEENLSRSNFDMISDALKKTMNSNVKTERNGRSAYDVIDQIRFQEDAMSGYALKAFSVSLDTFCSICNTVKPVLTSPINIIYNISDRVDAQKTKERFDFKNSGYINDKQFMIAHTQYGWSNDNRNVDNMILTSYSSQTTAYILDAIKEGAIPNVNLYTFPAFKTLANIGCNYMTSVPFIMQPGISRIAKHYKVNKSIYTNNNINPIDEAIKDIAKDLGFKVEFKTSMATLLKNINEKYKEEFNKLFRVNEMDELNISEANSKIPINQQMLLDRLNEEGLFDSSSPVERKLLFDLGTVLTFANLNTVAKKVSALARCCNPDKFGAKQTVYSTNQVFDDIEDHINENKPILVVGDKHFLEAIYPGAEEGLDSFLSQDRISESSYKSMYSFLKYSTGISIKLASQILDTQNQQFKTLVNSIRSAYSSRADFLTEKEYTDYQRHCLNYFYHHVPSVKNAIGYNLDEGNISVNLDSNSYQETQRIYGMNRPANLKADYIIGEGETRSIKKMPFVVQDISNPTQQEIDAYLTMSPAQKIAWIKDNFDDPGLFKYITVTLFNGKNRGYRQGIQTIEYIDQNIDPNILYNEFDKVFFNQNPLIKLATIDMIKYAIQVEGMRFSKTGIFKLISNSAFRTNIDEGGLGFVDSVMNQMTDPANYTDENRERILDTYLRSHIDEFYKIRTYYSNRTKDRDNGLIRPDGTGLLWIKPELSSEGQASQQAMDEFEEKLVKMGIRYKIDGEEVSSSPNRYIKITSYGNTTLYKIHDFGDQVMLAPMDALMKNEFGDISINPKNNKSLYSSAVYDKAVTEYLEDRENASMSMIMSDIARNMDVSETAKGIKNMKAVIDKKGSNLDFKIEEEAKNDNGIYVARQQIADFINGNPAAKETYIKNISLSNFIRNNKESSIQTIKLAPGKYAKVKITKVDFNTMRFGTQQRTYAMNNLLKTAKAQTDRSVVEKAKRDLSQKPWLNQDLFRYVANAMDYGLTRISDLYKVEPLTINNTEYEVDTNNALNLETTNKQVFDFLTYARDSRNDENAAAAVYKLNSSGVVNNLDSIKLNNDTITRINADYALKTSNNLSNEFISFCPDPDNEGDFMQITDPRVMNAVKQSEAIRNKYLRVLNTAVGFVNRFQHYFDFDVQGESIESQHFINVIKEAVNKVRDLPIEEVNHNFNEEYYGKMSNNPLIQEQVIDVLDNYWKLTGVTGQIHDIWESGNPIVQLVLKDVNGDIEAKRMQTIKAVQKFQETIADFEKRGAKLSDVIDENGQLIHDYSPEFVEKLYSLKEAATKAAQEFGYGSLQHLKAKNEFDEFKANHINQEANPEYYIKSYKLDKYMLRYHPRIFEAYQKLRYKRSELYSFADKDDPNIKEQIAKINLEMKNLYDISDVYIVGDVHIQDFSKKEYAEGQKILNEYKERPRQFAYLAIFDPTQQADSIYDIHEAKILNQWIEQRTKLNETYFEYVDGFGFKEMLNKNLRIMESFEERRNGVSTVPIDVLMQNKIYAEARNWVMSHARFKIKFENEDNTSENSLKKRLAAAYKILKRNRNNKSVSASAILRIANGGKGINDRYGIPNGNLVSETDLAKLKKATEQNYNISGMPVGTDRILISNAPIGDASMDLYKKEFYDGMHDRSLPSAKDNPQYLKLVTQLNKILEKYYDDSSKTVQLTKIPDTEEGIAEMEQIASLYQAIRAIKGMYSHKLTKEQKEFIEKNVEFVTNKTLYLSQAREAKEKSKNYQSAFFKVALETDENGNPVTDFETGKLIPNKMLFSFAKPKGQKGEEQYDKWIDTKKQGALELLNSVYTTEKTEYYYQAMHEAQQKDYTEQGYYDKWYNDNHVYNPYTRKYEPLACWIRYRYSDMILNGEFSEGKPYGEWESNDFGERKVKDGKEMVDGNEIYSDVMDMRNPNFIPDTTLAQNYVKGSQKGIYDNKKSLTDSQKELREYVQNTLLSLAKTGSAKKYFSKGYLPNYRKSDNPTAKDWIREAGKMFGFSLDNNKIGRESYYDEIGYNRDITPTMPGLKMLHSSKPINITDKNVDGLDEALKSLETVNYYVVKPESAEDIAKWEEDKKKVAEHNRKISNALKDNDWNTILPKFIEAAGRYNSVYENKEKLYQVLETLKHQKAYLRKYDLYGKLKKIDRNEENENAYATTVDNDLIKQYETYVRRLLWDQFKKPQGHYTRLLSRLQGFTSANYMMLNVRGGVANVTVGLGGILAEANAGEYFNYSDLKKGITEYSKGMLSYLSNMYSEKSYTLQDAAIKFFKAVDYDEFTGICERVGMQKWSERLRNVMYSPNSSGEHFMQNSVLIGMLNSHRIMTVEDDPFGIGAVAVNKKEYRNIQMAKVLNEILTDEQLEKFTEFKKDISKDKQKVSEYAWWRKNLLTEFIAFNCNKEQIKEFKKREKQLKDKIDKEFEGLKTLYDQIELKNSMLGFKEGSQLDELDKQLVGDGSSNVSKAVYLLGRFSNRVKKVNNKIHGVYNKMGRAQIEQNWWGSIVTQYHKHLVMGILKRYRTRGYFDETRGTVEKGITATMKDFLSLNARRIKHEAGLTDENVNALQSVQFWMKNSLKFLTSMNDTYSLLPDYEKSNVRRQLGDLVGVLAGLMTVIGLYGLGGGDDNDDLMYNFWMYEADRLASESFMYNPIGLYSEGKTLFSTPVACQSIITDALNGMYQIAGFIMEGDDFDATYKSGRFAGQGKIGTYIMRRIPMWSAVNSIMDLPNNNHYYKIGGKPLSIVDTKAISDIIF